jgi:hypothetical protein
MAGITYLAEFQEPALRGIVDETLENIVPGFADRFLPNDQIFDTKFAYDIIKKSNNIAGMIGYGAEPPVVDRDQVASKMGELAKFGLKYIATEEELLALNQARSDAEQSALVSRLVTRGADMVRNLNTRVDLAKAEAISKGSIAYDKNGVKVNVDFGIPAEHKVALSDTADWDTADHDVIGDLLEWVQTYEDNNDGQSPDVILLSREVQALLLKNSVIVNEARGANSGSTRVSEQELNSVLGGYGLPPVQVVTRRKLNIKNIYTGADEQIEFFPVNRVVMVAEGVGNFLFGPTVENNFQPGVVLQAKDKDEPIQSILRVAAAGFPVVEVPSLLFHADVYTP